LPAELLASSAATRPGWLKLLLPWNVLLPAWYDSAWHAHAAKIRCCTAAHLCPLPCCPQVPPKQIYPAFFSDQASDISPELSDTITAALTQLSMPG